MSSKDQSSKAAHDLNQEDFVRLYGQYRHEYEECPKDRRKMLGCKAFMDIGLWDKFYRKQGAKQNNPTV